MVKYKKGNLDNPGYVFLSDDMIDAAKQMGEIEGKGTVDELGFGALFGRMADSLFPWCSTLTSRARYIYYSAAVLDLAGDTLRAHIRSSASHDPQEAIHLANEKTDKFISEALKIEKQIAFSLICKHPGTAQGIFGIRRVNRFYRENDKIRGSSKILSANGRYPNAIYRGACKALKVFPSKGSSNSIILAHKFVGQNALTPDWLSACAGVRSEVKSIMDFWLSEESSDRNVGDTIEKLKQSSLIKRLRGFALTYDEASFLYSKIQESTHYWKVVKPTHLCKVVTKQGINLQVLKALTSQPRDKQLITAADHIWRATHPFIEVYDGIVKDEEKILGQPLAVSDILSSIKWLDKHCVQNSSDADWGQAWATGYGDLLGGWLKDVGRAGKVNSKLAQSLRIRAEEIVVQGRNKMAPHQRPKKKMKELDEDDVRIELEPDVSGYRLRNAARILQDIVTGFENAHSK